MKLTYEFTIQSAKTGKPLKRKKRFEANSEAEARKLAEEAGLIVIDATVIDFWHTVRGVAGVSFKNPDNTSRYKVIRDCKAGDTVILEHESGNRHDKNAIRVLDASGRQMGFLPSETAASIMKWYKPNQSPIVSAVIDNIETWDGGGCPNLRLVVAAPSATDEKIIEALKADGVSNPSKHLPRNILESKPRVVLSHAQKGDSGGGGGCMVLLTVLAVACVAVVLSIWRLICSLFALP
ncbi:MAG: HIRAN domain-containing protein [Deltaproteobacteria bacterium]|nr:HIRAN domain-containing protein [Deltaproteobacteria bacterium]